VDRASPTSATVSFRYGSKCRREPELGAPLAALL
jgi:hypothetical protein